MEKSTIWMVCRKKNWGYTWIFHCYVSLPEGINVGYTTRDGRGASDLGRRGWFVVSWMRSYIWNLRILKNHRDSCETKNLEANCWDPSINPQSMVQLYRNWMCFRDEFAFFEHNLAKTFQKITLQLEKHFESDYLSADMSNQNPSICTSSPNESWDLKTNGVWRSKRSLL